MNQEPIIVKFSGDRVPFSEQKFRQSLRRSGAPDDIVDMVVQEMRHQLRDGMTTQELHRRTRAILQKLSRNELAGRYDLKRAIMRLGPTGFPFEKYVAEIFKVRGYSVTVDARVKGHCVLHEVDVLGINQTERILVECKFHQEGGRCSIQTALYVKARYDDIQEACEKDASCGPRYNGCWLVTNTKFTSMSIDYGQCRGLNLLAWGYPFGQGLETLIDQAGLHPITCLPSLTFTLTQKLIQAGIILCKDIAGNENLLRKIGFGNARIDAIMRESRLICQCKSAE